MFHQLSLFPLNTVLFPGMPLTLHIFEERYKLMVQECIRQRQPFGVVLIESGQEALGPLAHPHAVGCKARIAQVQQLAEGRMNLLVLGEERFRIQTLEHDRPYLVGTVEPFPLSDPRPEDTAVKSRQLRPLLVAYLHLLSEAGNVEFDPTQLPEEPVSLAFLAAALLQAPPERKQELLACENAAGMLTRMCSLFRQEVPLLRLMLQNEAGKLDGPGKFSPN
jgi:Lon protease-like protein